MARINTRDFVGTRAKFQRLRDSHLFNGWIEDFFGSKLEVSTPPDVSVEVGDEFRFEGFGHHISVAFNAKLENVVIEPAPASHRLSADVSNSSNQEPRRTTLSLAVTSPVRFAASSESVRLHADRLPVKIQYNGLEISGFTLDVAPNGIGAIVTDAIEPTTSIVCSVLTPFGWVRALAVARYCIVDTEHPSGYRLGIMFTDMGRLERPRWERFISEPIAA